MQGSNWEPSRWHRNPFDSGTCIITIQAIWEGIQTDRWRAQYLMELPVWWCPYFAWSPVQFWTFQLQSGPTLAPGAVFGLMWSIKCCPNPHLCVKDVLGGGEKTQFNNSTWTGNWEGSSPRPRRVRLKQQLKLFLMRVSTQNPCWAEPKNKLSAIVQQRQQNEWTVCFPAGKKYLWNSSCHKSGIFEIVSIINCRALNSALWCVCAFSCCLQGELHARIRGQNLTRAVIYFHLNFQQS